MILVADVNGIASTGSVSMSNMKVVDLNAEDTEISISDGVPTIPYKYEEWDEETTEESSEGGE